MTFSLYIFRLFFPLLYLTAIFVCFIGVGRHYIGRPAGRVPVGQLSKKLPCFVGRLGWGPRLVGRIRSEVRVSASLKNARLVGRLGSGPRLVADRADVVPANRVNWACRSVDVVFIRVLY